MSELEKAPTVGAFTEVLARTRVPTAFFEALEGVVITEVICDGCRTNVGTPRYWDSPQGPAGGHFCDRCEDVLAAARQRLAEGGYYDDRGYWVSPTLRALRELEKAAAA
jgi:hypothetical protein